MAQSDYPVRPETVSERSGTDLAAATAGDAADYAAVRDWLSSDARAARSMEALLEQTAERLVGAGLPIERAMLSIRTIHPQIIGTRYSWKKGSGVDSMQSGWNMLHAPDYLESPIRLIHDGADMVRERIVPGQPSRFEIVDQLAALGFTDYVMFALVFTDGARNCFSIATREPGGFTDADIANVQAIVPLLTLQIEIRAGRQVAEVLLDTYVGHQAGARVLAGDIRRGEGQTMEAVILYLDLCGFTAMSNARPLGEVIATLNTWFDTAGSAVDRHGGQVLKFIGDGMLAIVPLMDAAFRHYACRQALQAVSEIETEIAELNVERRRNRLPEMCYRIGLHVGELVYGNIGATNRLDFTAIGPAVNLTARLEELAGNIDANVVASAEFAETAAEYATFVSKGRFDLRGMDKPVEVFVLKSTGQLAHRDGQGAEPLPARNPG